MEMEHPSFKASLVALPRAVENKKIENEKGINNYYVSQRDHQTLDDANVANDANDANDSNDSNDLNDSNDSNYSK
ncbi:unnamed protein product [Rhizophagus irregularis]|nr:unnamed protein product [Rhizophagus irregularis]